MWTSDGSHLMADLSLAVELLRRGTTRGSCNAVDYPQRIQCPIELYFDNIRGRVPVDWRNRPSVPGGSHSIQLGRPAFRDLAELGSNCGALCPTCHRLRRPIRSNLVREKDVI